MSEKNPTACKCFRELKHLHNMDLMLMEAMADKSESRTKFYTETVREAIGDVGKCARVDLKSVADNMDKVKSYADKGEIRPVMRVLEDNYWSTIHKVCTKGK